MSAADWRAVACLALLAGWVCGCSAVPVRPKTVVRTVFNINPAAPDTNHPDFHEKMDSETGTVERPGNVVRLLTNGEEAFPAMLDAIRVAEIRISIQTYIFRPDGVGNAFVEALCDAARRGVTVRVVGDAFGCQKMTSVEFARFAEAGVMYRSFNPLLHWTIAHINNRNHRKILVTDGATAFLGGLNLADEYDGDGFTGWRDTALVIRGPAARDAEAVFAESWNQAGTDFIGKELPVVGMGSVKHALERPFRSFLRHESFAPEDLPVPSDGPSPVRIVGSSPNETYSAMLRMHALAINSARKRVWITNGYFVPPVILSRALVNAAKRGVDVRLILQGETDEPTVRLISMGFYGKLLRQDVRIYEWDHPILHAKTMLCDDDWATVGSSNLDGRALFLNYEANAVVRDEAFTAALAARFEKDLESCRPVTLEAWQRRGFRQKAGEILLLPLEGQF